jgi:hypothetical protein
MMLCKESAQLLAIMSGSMLIEWIISITREEIMSYNRAVYR